LAENISKLIINILIVEFLIVRVLVVMIIWVFSTIRAIISIIVAIRIVTCQKSFAVGTSVTLWAEAFASTKETSDSSTVLAMKVD